MATTASLLQTYLVDLTHASEEEGDDHTTQTTNVISACIEILLQADDYVEYGFPIDGDEIAKMAHRHSSKQLQRSLRKHTLIWAGITLTLTIWALTIGLAL
jgi:hypothetical protein